MKNRRVIVGLLVTIFALLYPMPTIAYAPGDLENGVFNASGISRTIDPALQARAVVRSSQIISTFGHCCINWNEGEIIAWNNYPDPVPQIINQWVGSPPHWAIMISQRFDRIGCGATLTSNGRFYAVCLFADTESPSGPIPDTSMTP